MENERRVNLVGILIQVGLFILLLIALVVIFPTKKNISNNVESDNQAAETMLFNQNLISMKDAGREYFTISRMPKTEGESYTLTLGEMLDKSMVVDLVDGSGKACNGDASYIKVTKVSDEYEMQVVLTCDGTTKKIVTTIGCYDYCSDNLCEKDSEEKKECSTVKNTLYQYQKTVKGSSYWSDWSSWSKTKVVATSTKQVETKFVNSNSGTIISLNSPTVNKNYYCPSGYTLSSDNQTCSKTVNSVDTTNVITNTTKSCPSGYTLATNGTSCVKTVYDYIDRTPVYGTKTLSTSATPHIKVSFECSEAGVCQTVSKVDYYYCKDSSYTLSGKTCVKTVTDTETIASYTCPTGYNLGSDNCYKATTQTENVITNTTKSCPSGYTISSDKSYCSKTVSKVETVSSQYTTSLSCKEGSLNSDNVCQTTTAVTSSATYYRYRTYITGSNKTYTKWSSSSNDTSLINSGYTKTGKTKVETTQSCK